MTDHILSNSFNETVDLSNYEFDPALCVVMEYGLGAIDLPVVDCPSNQVAVRPYRRRPQSPDLMGRLVNALRPCQHVDWLARRGVRDTVDIYSIDHDQLSVQDLLDLYIFPEDHIIARHGFELVDGPVFLDVRNGKLVGVCVRNVSTNLAYAADAKYTFSNFGWFLYGYDLYGRSDEIMVVEGVFDALAMRSFGRPAIAVGSCNPHVFQLACLRRKFDNLTICFDNDFWGHYGAYVASTLLRAPVCMPRLKDVSCHLETGADLDLRSVSQSDLRDLVVAEIYDYNLIHAAGQSLSRPLPYN